MNPEPITILPFALILVIFSIFWIAARLGPQPEPEEEEDFFEAVVREYLTVGNSVVERIYRDNVWPPPDMSGWQGGIDWAEHMDRAGFVIMRAGVTLSFERLGNAFEEVSPVFEHLGKAFEGVAREAERLNAEWQTSLERALLLGHPEEADKES